MKFAGFLLFCHFSSHAIYMADGRRFFACQKNEFMFIVASFGDDGTLTSPIPSTSTVVESDGISFFKTSGFMGNFIMYFSYCKVIYIGMNVSCSYVFTANSLMWNDLHPQPYL